MPTKARPRKPLGKLYLSVLVLVLIIISFLLGAILDSSRIPYVDQVIGIVNKDPNSIGLINGVVDFEDVNFALFWKAWVELEKNFVPTTDEDYNPVTNQEKVWGAIEGLASAYNDPYTVFLPPKENELFETEINGDFEGVGMEIGIRNDILTIVAPLKNTPADKAGLKAGDYIVKIDGKSTHGITVEEAVFKIRGEKGTTVTFEIYREDTDERLDISVVRDKIDIPILKTETIDREEGKAFKIDLYGFARTAPRLFQDALVEFQGAGTENLIIDLRGNPGGFLDVAVTLSSWFLEEGKPVVIEYRGETGEEKVHRSLGYNVFTDQLDLVILVDGGSASASEIMAGALRDHERAVLVGTKTFGKGSVQSPIKLTEDTMLKVTIARWLTPNRADFSEGGLVPDYEVKFSEEDISEGRDIQLEKALEILFEDE